jgi:hypothetical protein
MSHQVDVKQIPRRDEVEQEQMGKTAVGVLKRRQVDLGLNSQEMSRSLLNYIGRTLPE